MAKENEDDVFTFTWSIQNFSHCALVEGGELVSPKFQVKFLGDEFCLKLCPRGYYEDPGFFSCLLYSFGKRFSEFNFRSSIFKSSGLFAEKDALIFPKELNSMNAGLEKALNLQELEKPDSPYIDNDTLTIRCQLWKKAFDCPVSILCYAHTKVKLSKICYTWTIGDVDQLQYKVEKRLKIPHCSKDIPNLEIQLLNREEFYFDNDTMYIKMSAPIPRMDETFLLVYGIHLLDADGNAAHSRTGKHLFEMCTETHDVDFPFLSKRELLSNVKQYLPNNVLTLQCEFCISFRDPESVVEKFEYRKKDALKMKAIPAMNRISEENDHLKEIMHKLLMDSEFSDFVISTPSKQFPVHRAILCAQSEVFTAMLKHNMKEKNSNVVEIEDLEHDTVWKMLEYLYTHTLGDIDSPTAQKLYYAANKYRITTLQKSCSNYLVRNLDVSNVTEILVLADTHQDQDLKSCIKAFILEQVFEVTTSEKWKGIMATHSHLTTEILQEIIQKKLLDRKFVL